MMITQRPRVDAPSSRNNVQSVQLCQVPYDSRQPQQEQKASSPMPTAIFLPVSQGRFTRRDQVAMPAPSNKRPSRSRSPARQKASSSNGPTTPSASPKAGTARKRRQSSSPARQKETTPKRGPRAKKGERSRKQSKSPAARKMTPKKRGGEACPDHNA